jgi:hypothetical protein
VAGHGRLLSDRKATSVLRTGAHGYVACYLEGAQQLAPVSQVGVLCIFGRWPAIADIWTSLLAQIELFVAKAQHGDSEIPGSPISFELWQVTLNVLLRPWPRAKCPAW